MQDRNLIRMCADAFLRNCYMKLSWRNTVPLQARFFSEEDNPHEFLIEKYINNTLSVCLALLFKD